MVTLQTSLNMDKYLKGDKSIDDSSKRDSIGQSGLVNLGNTCYINSAMQLLIHAPILREYFLSKEYKNDLNRGKQQTKFVKEYYRLLKGIYEEKCTVSPVSFVTNFKGLDSTFSGWRQNDSQEALSLILETLHIALSSEVIIESYGEIKTNLDKLMVESIEAWKNNFKKEYSFIVNMVYGQYKSSLTSIEEENKGELLSNNFEPFAILNVPVSGNTLYECMDEFVKPEILKGDNRYRNEKNGKLTEVAKSLRLWKTPNLLFIGFKRFSFNNKKITKLITFPLNDLDLSAYIDGYDKDDSIYDLIGIINHFGGTTGGHYTAFCKNHDGFWYHFDDSTVSPIDNLTSMISNSAYILLYSKKSK